MKIIECEQGTDEWHKVRLGIPTASCFEKIISPTGKESTQADKYMNVLIAEKMRGERFEKFKKSTSMERGNLLEEEAAQYYSLLREVDLVKIGFCTNDEGTVGCSVDRFVGSDGILEIKCPDPDNHVEHMLKLKLEQDHRPQTQGQLWITGRKWVDTICYNPKMQPVIIRSTPDTAYIMDMSRLMKKFLDNMSEKTALLKERGYYIEAQDVA